MYNNNNNINYFINVLKKNQKIRKVRANELESDIDYNPIS